MDLGIGEVDNPAKLLVSYLMVSVCNAKKKKKIHFLQSNVFSVGFQVLAALLPGSQQWQMLRALM